MVSIDAGSSGLAIENHLQSQFADIVEIAGFIQGLCFGAVSVLPGYFSTEEGHPFHVCISSGSLAQTALSTT